MLWNRKFAENRCSDSHILLKGVNDILPIFKYRSNKMQRYTVYFI